MLWPRQGLGDARVEKHASSHLIRKLWLGEYPIPHEGRAKVFSGEAGAISSSGYQPRLIDRRQATKTWIPLTVEE
jgi:hypothetical protein